MECGSFSQPKPSSGASERSPPREPSPNHRSSGWSTAGAGQEQADKGNNSVLHCRLLVDTAGGRNHFQSNLLPLSWECPRLAARTRPVPPLSMLSVSPQAKLGCSRGAFPLQNATQLSRVEAASRGRWSSLSRGFRKTRSLSVTHMGCWGASLASWERKREKDGVYNLKWAI